MNPISKQFSSIEQVTGQYLKQKNVTSPSKTSDVSFEDVLRQQRSMPRSGWKAGISAYPRNRMPDSKTEWNRHMPRGLRIPLFW